MTRNPGLTASTFDSDIATLHVMQRAYLLGESSASLSAVFNRLMVAGTLAAALWGGFHKNVPVSVAATALLAAHAANARFSARRASEFRTRLQTGSEQIVRYGPRGIGFLGEPLRNIEFRPDQLSQIGQQVQVSAHERAIKYGLMAADTTALAALSYTYDHVGLTLAFAGLAVLAARTSGDRLAISHAPTAGVARQETAAFVQSVRKAQAKPAQALVST